MLQQSTMQSVLPYFERWIKRFPQLEDLCAASEAEVLKLWQGLGYYQRARNLHAGAQMLAQFRRSHSRWPERAQEWREIKGVGAYTAAAIAAIAFSDKVLPVDGNVLRVLSRYWRIPDPLNSSLDRMELEKRFAELALLLPHGSHGAFAQAFMELGSLICRPTREPQCEICPLAPGCESRSLQDPQAFPRPKKRRETEQLYSLNLIYQNPQSSVLLRQIPKGRRLAGQWELPHWEVPKDEVAKGLVARINRKFELIGPLKHAITHHQYEAFGVRLGPWGAREKLPEGHAFASDLGPQEVLTTLTRKILFEVEKSRV
jgi:A/G-specific adenine glycosylase